MKILFSILEMFRCLNFFLTFAILPRCPIILLIYQKKNAIKVLLCKKSVRLMKNRIQFKIDAEKTPR